MKKISLLLIFATWYLAILPTAEAEDLRQETGIEASLTFTKNTSVVGDTITLNNGTIYRNCYFTHTPHAGMVTNGVIYPWNAETTDLRPCTLSETHDKPKKSPQRSPTPTQQTRFITGTVWVDYNNNHSMDCDNKLRCDKALSDVSVWTIATYSGFRACEGITSLTINAKTDSDGKYRMEIPNKYHKNGIGGPLCYMYPHRIAVGKIPEGFTEIRGTQIDNGLYEIRLVPTLASKVD